MEKTQRDLQEGPAQELAWGRASDGREAGIRESRFSHNRPILVRDT